MWPMAARATRKLFKPSLLPVLGAFHRTTHTQIWIQRIQFVWRHYPPSYIGLTSDLLKPIKASCAWRESNPHPDKCSPPKRIGPALPLSLTRTPNETH